METELSDLTCEAGEQVCGEWASEQCFYCEDALCEQHARLIPGCTLLYACPGCYEKHATKRIPAQPELVERERFYSVVPNSEVA